MAIGILTLGVLFFSAHFFVQLFPKTKIPDVLFLVLLGLIAGPILGLIRLEDFGKTGPLFTSLALVIILFQSGTDLELKALGRSLPITLGLTLTTFFLTAGLGFSLGHFLLGLPLLASFALGFAVGGTSSAVVIPMVKLLKMDPEVESALILESALTDVLCVIGVFSVIQVEAGSGPDAGRLIGSVMSSLVFAGVIGLTGSFLWLLVLNSLRNFPNTIFSTLAFLLILYGVAEFLGFSGAITSLAFGVGLTNQKELKFHKVRFVKQDSLTKLTPVEQSFFSEMVFILKTFFFVYLGVSIPFRDLNAFLWALAFTGVLLILRFIIVRLTVRGNYPPRQKGIAMVLFPKGLAAAVLAGLPLEQGMEGGEGVQSMTYMIILVTIVFAALGVMLLESGAADKPMGFFFPGAKKKSVKQDPLPRSISVEAEE